MTARAAHRRSRSTPVFRVTSAPRRRGSGSAAVWLGVYGRDSRYRVPDARCRYGYRLAPAGMRARRRLRASFWFWILVLIAGAAVRSAVIPVLGTAILLTYAGHRYRVNHRAAPPAAVPGPAGVVRVRRPLSRAVKSAVWQRDGGRCRHCRISDADSVTAFGVHLHYDHIVPFSLGGSDEEDNIQLLCEPENLAKSNKYIG